MRSTGWLRSPESGNIGPVADVLQHVPAPVVKRLTDAERAFLEQPYVGVVTDLRPDGSPHSTVVWIDESDIWETCAPESENVASVRGCFRMPKTSSGVSLTSGWT